MELNHVTSLRDNSQRLPTPIPTLEPPVFTHGQPEKAPLSQPLFCLLAPHPPSRLLLLPDELKMEVISHLVEPVSVHRRVSIKQGGYRDRIMILHASHHRAPSAFYINAHWTMMLNAHYYHMTHFTFDFAPSTICPLHSLYDPGRGQINRLSLTSTALRHMPFHLPTIHSHLKCYRGHLSESLISNIRHISLAFSVWSSERMPGAIVESNHVSMINISHAVFVISAFGLQRGILKSLKVEVRVHQGEALLGSEESDEGSGGLEGVVEDLKRTFVVHNGGRRWWRRNLACLSVEYV